ncbi:MAG: 5-dehydro-4-deoxy-D-glucuronate isomerase, partial [Bacteroidaceae bacterium]|nr:5-dehydro-4-deoxy-D-glucuronate isomerase [Bacteroidaceae bacterium]
MKKTLITGLLLTSTMLMAQNHTNYELRYPTHPDDVRTYDTNRLRKAFAIEKVFSADEINIVYTMHDRFIVGGAMPVNNKALQLET